MSTASPPLTLFCIPFAGGSATSFRALQRACGTNPQVTALELPGRGQRFSERLLTRMDLMVDDLVTVWSKRVKGPCALLGHSMGAVVAFEMARRAQTRGFPELVHLVVSGAVPAWAARRRDRHQLPDQAFIEVLKSMGGLAPEVLASRELLELFLPILRADLTLLETHESDPQPPLRIPMTILHGTKDDLPLEETRRWQEGTQGAVKLHQIDGDHFFIQSHADEVARLLRADLLTLG